MLGAQLGYFFGLTVLVTMFVSAVAVWHYGQRVLAGMQGRAGVPLPVPAAAPPAVDRVHDGVSPGQLLAWERRFERRAMAAWLLGTGLAAVPVAAVYLAASGELHRFTQLVAISAVLSFAAVPVVVVMRGWGWRLALRFAALVMAGGALSVLATSMLERLARGRAPTADQLLNVVDFFKIAALMLAGPALMLALSLPRRIRQVVPLVFGTLVLFGLAPFLGARAFDFMAHTTAGMNLIFSGGVDLVRQGVFIVLALPAGWFVARRLDALAAAHAQKRFSDSQLQARAWWLMLVGSITVELAGAPGVAPWGAPAAVLAGLAFVPLNRWALRVLPPAVQPLPPRSLLFLRAFGWRARTERLFDHLGARWRAIGPITMIAAPDVVARSLDPVDLIGYLRGREGDTFVQDADSLRQRLQTIDLERDPDGRFRITEFCCRDDTWRATVVALMERADVVLMDLRGVADAKRGCAFELGELGRRVPASHIVLAVDSKTALAPVRAELGAVADRVVFCAMDGKAEHDEARLFQHLAAASSPA